MGPARDANKHPQSNDRSAANNDSGKQTKKEAACVATSGPSLGRKHPRRASAARGLPHRKNMHVRCTKSKRVRPIFFGKLDRTLGPCFYFIFEEKGRSLRKNGSGQSGRCGGAALN